MILMIRERLFLISNSIFSRKDLKKKGLYNSCFFLLKNIK